MAKKPNFPSKPCPKCSKPIHARSQSHEACGWVMDGKAASGAKPGKKLGRPKGRPALGSTVTVADIEAVKALVDRLGAEKLEQLARVLG